MALALVVVELLAHHLDVGDLEVVGRELALVLKEDVAVGHGRAVGQVAPDEVVDARDALRVHGDALEAVGDLYRHRVALDAAHLLEVGELRDLHAVEPDLPAKAPGAQRGALPVVLDEADVVLGRVESDGLERAEVEVLRVGRARLDEHLELVVVLEAVGVLAVAAVGGAAAGLRVAGAPGRLAERAQQRGRVERAGAHLGVVRLHDGAAVPGPVVLEGQDHVLERERSLLAHAYLAFLTGARRRHEPGPGRAALLVPTISHRGRRAARTRRRPSR